MYTIKRAAELTGVSPATLRAWEERYGVAKPLRSDSGYRLYDEGALSQIKAMITLLAAGWSAKQAAARVLSSAPEQNLSAQAAEIARIAREVDSGTLATALDRLFNSGSFEFVVTEGLMPALRQIGEDWRAGKTDIAGEHMVSSAVLRRLGSAFEAAGSNQIGPRVLVGLPAGCQHEIPPLAFAVAARRAGLAVTYLGADLPVSAWQFALEKHPETAAVVMSLTAPTDVPLANEVADALIALKPELLVAVGGAFAATAGFASVRLTQDIGNAAAQLAGLLRN